MKIEMGESLGYSYLRHVRGCWLVQTNWKASDQWIMRASEDQLENEFRKMRQTFDLGGSVFKGTRDSGQFLRQAEVDVVGVGQDGSIHAMDVAFHEAGLNYSGGVGNRVLKKLLRTVLVLMAYHPPHVPRHIYFVSPKVHRAAQQPLNDIFDRLSREYFDISWHLFTNEQFASELLLPTLDKGTSVADMSELFLRSYKLLQLGEQVQTDRPPEGMYSKNDNGNNDPESTLEEIERPNNPGDTSSLQGIVRRLMTTLLDTHPGLLTQTDLENLQDERYCNAVLGLSIGNLPLLREAELGREISGHSRYWRTLYGGHFYVSSQWWKEQHRSNATALQAMVSALIEKNQQHPGKTLLQKHWQELKDLAEDHP
ncbi:MAG: hypothetical protein OXI91_13390 [Chloroflexota bacterium]|nr:hypothetical protein [Chloroflexota bacterium]